ncbi:MAG: hypothetical protein JST36_01955 [Bacteroidetes bacterium]|nr:hypothetical protein [Bacteroidota bacterium]
MNLRLGLVVVALVALTACKDSGSSKSRGPIILGDSSMIVTEHNPEVLQDLVPDLKPTLPSPAEAAPAKDSTPTPAATPTPTTTAAAPPSTGPALVAEFKEITLTIPGIETKVYGKQDLKTARSATYQLRNGSLDNAKLYLSGATLTKVNTRYQTELLVQDGKDELALDRLGKYTSDWQKLNGNAGPYPVVPAKPEYKELTATAIRNAVQQETRRKRMSRKEAQDWLEEVRRVRSVQDAPMKVMLRAIMWRIEGKDAQGKSFSKELRLDIPRP